jgi:magnesium-transporting ATPase (P-type)
MVTGDNKDTARAIAKECGILTSADDENLDSVMEGKIFLKIYEVKDSIFLRTCFY